VACAARNAAGKNCHLGTIAQLCRAISLQLRHVSTIGKKLLSSNISSTCPYNMVNFGPLAAEIVSLVWGTPANFNGFRVLASFLQRHRSTEANQTLHDVSPSPARLHYIYTVSQKMSHLWLAITLTHMNGFLYFWQKCYG